MKIRIATNEARTALPSRAAAGPSRGVADLLLGRFFCLAVLVGDLGHALIALARSGQAASCCGCVDGSSNAPSPASLIAVDGDRLARPHDVVGADVCRRRAEFGFDHAPRARADRRQHRFRACAGSAFAQRQRDEFGRQCRRTARRAPSGRACRMSSNENSRERIAVEVGRRPTPRDPASPRRAATCRVR